MIRTPHVEPELLDKGMRTNDHDNTSTIEGVMRFSEKLAHPKVHARARQWYEHRATSTPAIIELDPTTACNYSCPNCISADLLQKGEIPTNELLDLIRDAASSGVAGVIFIGGGEPLAHSSMPAPIELAKEVGLAVGITTNGYFIERHVAAVGRCADWTRVSVDASNTYTYRELRPNRDRHAFMIVLRGIEKLNNVKRGTVGFSFLLTRNDHGVSNYREVAAAAETAKSLGCDYFEVKPSVTQEHHVIPIPPHARPILREQLATAEALNDAAFKVVVANSLEAALLGETVQPKCYTICPSVELRTVITPDSFYVCPYKRGKANNGWPRGELLADAWKSGLELRASINPADACPFFCIRHDLNMHLLEMAQFPTAQTDWSDPFV